MAIVVILTSFVILGTFLWVSTTYLTPVAAPVSPVLDEPIPTAPIVKQVRIPCEKDGSKIFILPTEVAFVRADGHYTQVYTDADRLFCALPITEAAKRLIKAGHVQVHRSYVVNPEKVSSFERKKDNGVCSFLPEHCPQVPVSRSKLKAVQDILGV